MPPVSLFSPEPARGWLPWAWLAPILLIVFVAAPVIGLDGWMQAQHWSDPRGRPIGMPGLYALLWLSFAPTLAAVLAWVHWVERRSLASIGLGMVAPLQHLARGLGVGMGMISVLVAAMWVAGALRVDDAGPAWRDPAGLLHIAALLPSFLFQAGTEEIIFRGWLLSVLARRANLVVAVVVVSLVFCLLHYGPHQPFRVMLVTFLFSLFACAWVLRDGHVWGAIGWHAGWNWWLATGFELPVTGIDAKLPALLVALRPQGAEAWTGGAEGPEGSWLCNLLFVVALAWMQARGKKNGGPKPAVS